MCYVITFCLPFLGQAQTAEVQVAGSNYPVLFADTNLSFAVRQRIASDLTIAFSPAPSFEEAMGGGLVGSVEASIPLPGGGTAVTSLNGRDYWDGVFKPSTLGLMLPDGERREGIFLVDYNNQKSLRLNKVASSNYLHAFTLVDAHSNTVQKALAFATTLKNTDWDAQPLQVLKDLLHMTPGDREEFPEDAYLGFAKDIQQAMPPVTGVSALGFSLQKRPEVGGEEVLVYGGLLLFYDGRWGFGKFPFW